MKNYNIIFVLSFFLYMSCLSSGNQNDIQSGDENITDSDTSCNEKNYLHEWRRNQNSLFHLLLNLLYQ